MASINFLHFWKIFVSDFVDVQENKIAVEDEVKDYHPIVQSCLCKLGWTNNQGLHHHYSLGRKNERPDFFIKFDANLKHNQGIPIEVKLPNNVMNEEDRGQLLEYMRLSDSNIGIYIGEHVRVFYRPSIEEELKIVIDAAFTNDDIAGLVFAELFFNGTFNIEILKTELNKYYRLERLIDEKRLKESTDVIESLPAEWLPDRYAKRALLQTQKSSEKKGEKNRTRKNARLTPVSTTDEVNNELGAQSLTSLHQELQTSSTHSYNPSTHELPTKKATTIMPKDIFNALQLYCTRSDIPKHRAIYLFILDGLHANNIITDKEYIYYKKMSTMLTTTYSK